MAIITFKMQKKIIEESEVNGLEQQYANWKQKILYLSQEK
jgi:virulence-associated protein VapD